MADAALQAEVQLAEAEENERTLSADPGAARADKRLALDTADAAEAELNTARSALRSALNQLLADLSALAGEYSISDADEPPAFGTASTWAREGASVAYGTEEEEEEEEEEVEPESALLQHVPLAMQTVPTADFAGVPAGFSPPAQRGTAQAETAQPLQGLLPDLGSVEESPAALPLDEAEDHSQEPATIWTGRLPLDEVMTRFLDQGELALACHLADLAEENGMIPPVPSGLLKSLVASEVMTGPYDAAAQTLGEWLAAAMAEVETAETLGQTAGLRARSVALAALLRPALMARDTNARDHLRALSLADGLQAYAPIVAILLGLRRDLQPSLSDLTELAGGEKQRRLPAALAAIREWLPGARKAQTMHAPTGMILHKLLDAQGEMGTLSAHTNAGFVEGVTSDRRPGFPFATGQTLLCASLERSRIINLRGGQDMAHQIRKAIGAPVSLVIVDLQAVFDRVVRALGFGPREEMAAMYGEGD